ncbi:MAG: (2Fe-2S)-binding protein [Chloroflexi bacterium]|nr:(2Fe-2S)-binding protein [Chloroflexota bacterium]
MTKRILEMELNGTAVSLEVDPSTLLIEVLRDGLGLTGSKRGCLAGDCGSCTVLLDDKPVLACLIPALRAHGKRVLTVEGLSRDGRLHPLQQAFIESGAIQCGYCTPGMLLSSLALLKRNPRPTEDEVKLAISGNLCRCTGYNKIIAAVLVAADRMVE